MGGREEREEVGGSEESEVVGGRETGGGGRGLRPLTASMGLCTNPKDGHAETLRMVMLKP